MTHLLFPAKNRSVGSAQESLPHPTCPAPRLLQHCWWGTALSCHSECLWRNGKINDHLPCSPSTSTVFLPPSAFPELLGQKFKSCFEQLLTCYRLLHRTCSGWILIIPLETGLLNIALLSGVSVYKKKTCLEGPPLSCSFCVDPWSCPKYSCLLLQWMRNGCC